MFFIYCGYLQQATLRDPSNVIHYGSIGTETRKFEFSEFLPDEDKFAFTIIYWHYLGYHDLLVTFRYQPGISNQIDLTNLGFIIGGPIERSGMVSAGANGNICNKCGYLVWCTKQQSVWCTHTHTHARTHTHTHTHTHSLTLSTPHSPGR